MQHSPGLRINLNEWARAKGRASSTACERCCCGLPKVFGQICRLKKYMDTSLMHQYLIQAKRCRQKKQADSNQQWQHGVSHSAGLPRIICLLAGIKLPCFYNDKPFFKHHFAFSVNSIKLSSLAAWCFFFPWLWFVHVTLSCRISEVFGSCWIDGIWWTTSGYHVRGRSFNPYDLQLHPMIRGKSPQFRLFKSQLP